VSFRVISHPPSLIFKGFLNIFFFCDGSRDRGGGGGVVKTHWNTLNVLEEKNYIIKKERKKERKKE